MTIIVAALILFAALLVSALIGLVMGIEACGIDWEEGEQK